MSSSKEALGQAYLIGLTNGQMDDNHKELMQQATRLDEPKDAFVSPGCQKSLFRISTSEYQLLPFLR